MKNLHLVIIVFCLSTGVLALTKAITLDTVVISSCIISAAGIISFTIEEQMEAWKKNNDSENEDDNDTERN